MIKPIAKVLKIQQLDVRKTGKKIFELSTVCGTFLNHITKQKLMKSP